VAELHAPYLDPKGASGPVVLFDFSLGDLGLFLGQQGQELADGCRLAPT